MNWEAVAAIGELVGSIAVLATLVYVAIQVREARRDVRRSIQMNRAENARTVSLTRVNNPDLVALSNRANDALGSTDNPFVATLVARVPGMTRDDASRLWSEQMAWWNARTLMIAHVDELTPAQRSEFEQFVLATYRQPVSRLWLDTMKPALDPDAVRYVEGLLARTP